jgi:putative aldouronate transport system substrate-binding protein
MTRKDKEMPVYDSTRPVDPSRRIFLQGAFGAAALAAIGGSVLTACSPSGGAGGGAGGGAATTGGKATLPSYLRYQGLKPDLPGNVDGLSDAFFKFPTDRAKSVAKVPGDGSVVTALVESPKPTPPGKSQNAYWQHVSKEANVDLDLTIIPTGDWGSKFATAIAGGDIPDLVEIWAPPERPEMMPALFADLSKFIAGDAVKEYPNLANLSTEAWGLCAFDGGIYGVPVPRGTMSSLILFRRDDLIKAKDLDPDPANFEEFFALCRDLSDKKANTWALGGVPHDVLQQMVGLPAGWRDKGGALTAGHELPEAKETLAAAARLWAAGTIHPDSFSANVGPLRKQWFNSGTVSLVGDTYPAWGGYYAENTAGPSFDIGAMQLPGFDGGKPVTWRGNPIHNITGIKKADPKRVRMLLSVLDWLAAPFGTAEYATLNFGVEGKHFDTVDGEPIRNEKGNQEIALSLNYLAAGPPVFYQAGRKSVPQKQYDHQTWLVKHAVADPTLGLLSGTNSRQGEKLSKILNDARDAIVQGREKIDTWDTAVARWKSDGGDKIRGEYEKAIQETRA